MITEKPRAAFLRAASPTVSLGLVWGSLPHLESTFRASLCSTRCPGSLSEADGY
jgi:hypothetical protein